MTIFAISDIHGRIAELDHLLSFIGLQSDDTAIFLGDYIDRGDYSASVIDRLIAISHSMKNSYFLMGNHEEMALESRRNDEVFKYWMRYGGDKTLSSYGEGMPNGHWEFMESLIPYLETESEIYVHAGLVSHLPLKDQPSDVLRWDIASTDMRHYSNKKIFCGHSVQKSGFPALLGDARCIECAGWLTAINVENDFIYQVNAQGAERSFPLKG